MTPFSDTSDVSTEWRPTDFEQLTPYGHSMIIALGGWFARTYGSRFSNPGVLFRCSKSGRAKESGSDFITGYNKALNKECARISEKPTPFYTGKRTVDEDYFFRPWKAHKEVVDAIKSSAQLDVKFVEIALNNKEFLHDLYVLAGAKEELTRNTYKCFWSTTHLSALLNCESYWHNAHERTALLDRIPSSMRGRVDELASHVWTRRFTDSGVDPVMGGPLSLEILQQSLNRNCRLNIYSGHDYTILSVLGSMNLTRKITKASHFGSYLLFELWDGAGRDYDSSLHDCDAMNEDVEIDMSAVDPIQESCSAVGVGDLSNSVIQSSDMPYGRHLNDTDESDSTLGSYDVTPPNEVTDVTASNVTTLKNISEKFKKSHQLQNMLGQSENKTEAKNTFLQSLCNDIEDKRFLRILANFTPFEAQDDTSMNRLSHEVNEKHTIILAELSIQEIKQKHDFLFQSLTSRGFFVPESNKSQC